jgi:hypothetical protein
MRPAALALALLSAASLAPAAAAQERPANSPLVRMRDGHGSDLLFRVHPRTLRPLSRPIRTFRSGSDMALTADGRRMAYTGGWRAGSSIHFVDLAGWRSLGVARLGRMGPLGVGWVGPSRVVAIAGEGFGRQRLLWVDVGSRKVVARRGYTGRRIDHLPVPGGHALALAPTDEVGPLRLLIADATGGTRSVTIDGIAAGGNESEARARYRKPALAVDHEGGRLFVVAARGLLVAEVGLASGEVSYPALPRAADRDARDPGPPALCVGPADPDTACDRRARRTYPQRGAHVPSHTVPPDTALVSTAATRIDADFDVDRFLDRPLVAHVAAAGPSVRPVWFLWEEGAFWWLTDGWARLPSILKADPHVALVVDTCELESGTVHLLTAEGDAEIYQLDAGRARRMLHRYLGPTSRAGPSASSTAASMIRPRA